MEQAFAFIGPPGAGKDTMCEKVAEELGDEFEIISTRELLIQYGASKVIQAVELAPDELMCRLLIEKLQQVKKPYAAINTPRSERQCLEVIWDLLTLDAGVHVTTIHLEVDTTAAIQRMAGRKREDDAAAEKRLKRMEDYAQYGPAVLKWLTSATEVIHINASLPQEKVLQSVTTAIRNQINYPKSLVVPPAIRHGSPYPEPKSFVVSA